MATRLSCHFATCFSFSRRKLQSFSPSLGSSRGIAFFFFPFLKCRGLKSMHVWSSLGHLVRAPSATKKSPKFHEKTTREGTPNGIFGERRKNTARNVGGPTEVVRRRSGPRWVRSRQEWSEGPTTSSSMLQQDAGRRGEWRAAAAGTKKQFSFHDSQTIFYTDLHSNFTASSAQGLQAYWLMWFLWFGASLVWRLLQRSAVSWISGLEIPWLGPLSVSWFCD